MDIPDSFAGNASYTYQIDKLRIGYFHVSITQPDMPGMVGPIRRCPAKAHINRPGNILVDIYRARDKLNDQQPLAAKVSTAIDVSGLELWRPVAHILLYTGPRLPMRLYRSSLPLIIRYSMITRS